MNSSPQNFIIIIMLIIINPIMGFKNYRFIILQL